MIGERVHLVVVALLISGFFFLALPEEGFAGLATIECCQLEGSCFDSFSDGQLMCRGEVTEGEFCNEGTGLCQAGPITRNIPTLSEWALMVMAGVLGIAGYSIIRRRKAAA